MLRQQQKQQQTMQLWLLQHQLWVTLVVIIL